MRNHAQAVPALWTVPPPLGAERLCRQASSAACTSPPQPQAELPCCLLKLLLLKKPRKHSAGGLGLCDLMPDTDCLLSLVVKQPQARPQSTSARAEPRPRWQIIPTCPKEWLFAALKSSTDRKKNVLIGKPSRHGFRVLVQLAGKEAPGRRRKGGVMRRRQWAGCPTPPRPRLSRSQQGAMPEGIWGLPGPPGLGPKPCSPQRLHCCPKSSPGPWTIWQAWCPLSVVITGQEEERCESYHLLKKQEGSLHLSGALGWET